jgi:hypothetical protein
MNRREIILLGIGVVLFLSVLFGFYLPRVDDLNELNVTISRDREEINRLERLIPDRPLEGGRLSELIAEDEGLRALMDRDYDITLATGELVRICRLTEGITIDSITEVGEAGPEIEGLQKWLIKLKLRASFHDFAWLLHSLNDSGLPLAVEAFTITNEENRSPLSRIELTVAACVFEEAARSDRE